MTLFLQCHPISEKVNTSLLPCLFLNRPVLQNALKLASSWVLHRCRCSALDSHPFVFLSGVHVPDTQGSNPDAASPEQGRQGWSIYQLLLFPGTFSSFAPVLTGWLLPGLAALILRILFISLLCWIPRHLLPIFSYACCNPFCGVHFLVVSWEWLMRGKKI